MRSRGAAVGARRVVIARILLLLPFIALAARAAWLSVDERAGARGQDQMGASIALPPERGVIYDRNGAELALSVDAPSVYVDARALGDPRQTVRALAGALGVRPGAIARRIEGRSRFVFVKRWVSEEQARRVRALGLDGVGILDEPRRVYPNRALAAQLIGFANIDGRGVRGIEQVEDAWLRGTARRVPVERDARGRLLASAGVERWMTAGGDVALTIDSALQADAEAALAAVVERTGAKGGVVISLDPATGDILALAEAPSFDPNRFRELDYRATRSRSFLDAADPGSTLKSFLMAAALERSSVTPDQEFDCEGGSYKVPGSVIHDSHPHGILTVSQVLQVSSNICSVKIAFAVGPRAHFETLHRFGFGKVTGIGFPGESAGVVRPWKEWRPLDHATIAFGQGVSVTPIQLAAAMATLANGGEWLRPRVVKARRAARRPWQAAASGSSRRAVRRETAAAVLEMMELVVTPEGTARRAALRDVRVAGKTGTAQKFDRETGSYFDNRFEAWFMGAVHADDPRLVIVAGIDEPRRPFHTGGAAAAPLFAQVATAQLARIGIFTEPRFDTPGLSPARLEKTRVAARTPPEPGRASAPTPPVASPPPAAAVTGKPANSRVVSIGDRLLLPDFRGLSEREVRRITADSSLEVKMTGRGRAVSQDGSRSGLLAHGAAPTGHLDLE